MTEVLMNYTNETLNKTIKYETLHKKIIKGIAYK